MSEKRKYTKSGNTWTFASAKAEALKYKTKKEFRTTSASAYNFVVRNNFLDEACAHLIGRTKWTMETSHFGSIKI